MSCDRIGLNKRFAKEKVYEYQLLKPIISMEIVITVVSTSIFYLDRLGKFEPLYGLTDDPIYPYPVLWLWKNFANLSLLMIYAIIGCLVWIGSNSVNKDYYYYIVKGDSEHILENNWTERARHTISALKYYNKYLGKVLKFRNRSSLELPITLSLYVNKMMLTFHNIELTHQAVLPKISLIDFDKNKKVYSC